MFYKIVPALRTAMQAEALSYATDGACEVTLSGVTEENVVEKVTAAGLAGKKSVKVEGLGVFTAQAPIAAGRLAGKTAIVTGSAQGFGLGVAEAMLAEGAYVVIADLNIELAQSVAEDLCKKNGAGRAVACKVDVSNEESVESMIEDTVKAFGGLDIFVNNAGVLKAGSLEEMDVKSFEFVTKINYSAYYICTKYASRVMKLQHAVDPKAFYDIIQINSKSGLEGSNKNFAYAGGKFGGIGLTQSFALELVEYNIKVNSICPGNFFDGPLWSNPEKGLFVQYLNAGKVPGAKTIEDVKKFYEAKVPMRRGCETMDVARAIFYIVEQEYETGQAVPVTGGQVMLN
ncbi:MAG: SDR family NAD(P)-dependent oxidoreductase [Clostridia bacterium]|nr:SDR family NAD(P)-dependent oxidoreductase [Clostridia bacterium]